MMILITYDVNTTDNEGAGRLRRVARECQNYGQRVQNSVFECVLPEDRFVMLKRKIETIIDKENDSVRFYILGNNWERRIEYIGKETSYDVTGELII